jgi:hypothetical protein
LKALHPPAQILKNGHGEVILNHELDVLETMPTAGLLEGDDVLD